MPPRYAYWTIIAGGLPTAFRAAQREELLPTFQRIREKHPDAQMKWFARGKLWESPEAARVRHDDSRGRRPFGDTRAGDPRDRDRRSGPPQGDRKSAHSPPPAGEKRGARHDEAGPVKEKRSRDWRPGGEHRDPRQKFIDVKKQRNVALRQDRWQRKNAAPRERPHGDPPRDGTRREPGRDSPRGDWRARPAADRGAKPDLSRRSDAKADRPGQDRPRDPSRRSDPKADPSRRGDTKADPSRRGDAKADPSRRSDAKADARGPGGTGRWRPKPGGWDRKPGFRGHGTDEPTEPPRPRGPNREPRRDDTDEPAPPPRPDEPKVPPPGPSERGHIKSRRPFQPRHGHPKGPRRR